MINVDQSDVSPRPGVNAPTPAILVKDVAKSFPVSLSAASWIRHRGKVPRRAVLHDVSLTVRPGEVFGLLGPNGAGKTTLLKLLATLYTAEHGLILISGIDATKRPMAVRKRIGFCTSEERSFFFRLTARENLHFFGSLMGLSGGLLEQRIAEVVALVDLSSALDRRFDSFSSGMRQRLSVARALLSDPEVVFFDEPTRAVDPLHAREIRKMIRNDLVVGRGKTAVVATNDLSEAWSICDTVAIVQNGRIVATGSPEFLDSQFTQFTHYVVTLERMPQDLENRLRAISGVHLVTSSTIADGILLHIEVAAHSCALDDLLGSLAFSGATVRDFRSLDPEPLDVFVGITQRGDIS